jgi:hypothetical protein
MDLPSAFLLIWVLTLVPVGIQVLHHQRAYLDARMPTNRPQDAITPILDGTFVSVLRESLNALRQPQSDEQCERLRRRANRSFLVFTIVALVPVLLLMIGTVLYLIWRGPGG